MLVSGGWGLRLVEHMEPRTTLTDEIETGFAFNRSTRLKAGCLRHTVLIRESLGVPDWMPALTELSDEQRRFRQRYSWGQARKSDRPETLIVVDVSYGYFACNPRRTRCRWPGRLGT